MAERSNFQRQETQAPVFNHSDFRSASTTILKNGSVPRRRLYLSSRQGDVPEREVKQTVFLSQLSTKQSNSNLEVYSVSLDEDNPIPTRMIKDHNDDLPVVGSEVKADFRHPPYQRQQCADSELCKPSLSMASAGKPRCDAATTSRPSPSLQLPIVIERKLKTQKFRFAMNSQL